MAIQLIGFVIQHVNGKFYSLGPTKLVTLKNASQFTQREAIAHLKSLNQTNKDYSGYAPIFLTTKGVLYK